MMLALRNLMHRLRGLPPYVSVVGPIEVTDGAVQLTIPLEPYGRHLVQCTRGISQVVGDQLVIRLYPQASELG